MAQRTERKRAERLTDLLGQILAGLVAAALLVALIDGMVAWLGWADWGRTSGWLIVVLPVMMLVEQFRAAQGARGRWLVAALAALLGIGLGGLAAGLFSGLPALASGAIGGAVAVITYTAGWHVGLLLAEREG